MRRANAVWLGMILAGAALAAFVYLSWPEPTFRIVRLPYGESMPKTPAAERAPVRAARAVEPAQSSAPIVVAPAAAESAPRELAAAEPGPSSSDGPPPVPSESEADGYTESAEELGAEPLPGMGPQPAAAQGDHSAAPAGKAAEQPDQNEPDTAQPLLGIVIEPAP